MYKEWHKAYYDRRKPKSKSKNRDHRKPKSKSKNRTKIATNRRMADTRRRLDRIAEQKRRSIEVKEVWEQ